jgi:hypothetical protein
MKVTLDLRHVALCGACAVAGFALRAFAVPPPVVAPTPPGVVHPPTPPPDPAYPVTDPNPAVPRWEFFCVDDDTAHIEKPWAADVSKPEGWNRYLARLTTYGWEPAVFIAPQGKITAVCFRRPSGTKPATQPAPATNGHP